MVKDETRIVGDLPNLRMEIVHRHDAGGAAEHMIIHLSATPSFQAAETLLLGGLPPAAWSNPFALWSTMAQAWLAPWTQAFGGGNPWLGAPSRRDSE
ncbi:hypothetical protein H261_12121 [Paramagnetospirillum caucaseum]|uniref:Uncharacterized protein n=1 Tax=Paramagnetospirillum caucaseum TaxID=1244869 RepID=M2Z5S6_9PROT|nr:hypothetical protein [Paramagnetospirillum caucaseum]EME69660.1 hypothetical protein H261_12121 [Paramagnetospirillum caucaseum]